jgi:hypothetical protein
MAFYDVEGFRSGLFFCYDRDENVHLVIAKRLFIGYGFFAGQTCPSLTRLGTFFGMTG